MVRKYVLTGAGCTGKSTMIYMASDKSIYTIGEAAEYIIERELKKDESEQVVPWKDLYGFQIKVANTQTMWEREIPQDTQIALLDRGVIDGLGYCSEGKIQPPQELEAAVKNAKYEKVFILDPLEIYQNTEIRREDREKTARLHAEIEKAYRVAGYNPIRVPVMPKEQRLEYILTQL